MSHPQPGYYKHPTIFGDTVFFVCEGNLWSVPVSGGTAVRITTGDQDCSFPRVSPDGLQIAYVSDEDGPNELYVISSAGSAPVRITHMGGHISLSGWSSNGKKLLFAANSGVAFSRTCSAYSVSAQGGQPTALPLGLLESFSINDNGATVIGTNEIDSASWKRYRGGQKGELWIDSDGSGEYKHFVRHLNGNVVCPMWINGKVYFASDHEGIANIYSCLPDGSRVRKHTSHTEYYVRFPSTDGQRIVYTAGGDLFVLDPRKNSNEKISVNVPILSRQTERKLVPATEWLESFAPHPDGHSIALIARGQPIVRPNWGGHSTQHGTGNRSRYRLIDWMPDGKRFVVVNDAAGHERLEVHFADQSKQPVIVSTQDLGRFGELTASNKLVAVTNHRNELFVIDLETHTAKLIDTGEVGNISDVRWSPDGVWLAYTMPSTPTRDLFAGTGRIRVANAITGAAHDLTSGQFSDCKPAWDPEGNYIYFVSSRTFKPQWDAVKKDMGFIYSKRLYAVPLRPSVASPFIESPNPLVKVDRESRAGALQEGTSIDIDFDGILERVVAFPIAVGNYTSLFAAHGRVLFVEYDSVSAAHEEASGSWITEQAARHCTLWLYDFEQQRLIQVATPVGDVHLSKNGQFVFFHTGEGKETIRVFDVVEEIQAETDAIDEPTNEYSRRTGLIDLSDVEVSVKPQDEWAQIFHEAWRLQAQNFWTEDMSQVDWELVKDRYSRLLPRVRTRSDLGDVLWEVLGELGTSHAYQSGGDYQASARTYYQGYLGADFSWDKKRNGYRITSIIRGEPGEEGADSPLAAAGLGITTGDLITAVDGVPVSAEESPQKLLVNKAFKRVGLTIKNVADEVRQVTIDALGDEEPLRYRAWVNENRRQVHKKSKGRLGYVHIPDMSEAGYGEFYRSFQLEHSKQGLVVDVRYNGGGSVSSLILQVLLRQVKGWDISRWNGTTTYPMESVAGPKVAIANQFTASDGDIISHAMRLYNVGKVVGKRTWGGVIGIDPHHTLVDGTVITVPEYAFYFQDVGWSVENHGATPDFDVDISPQDWRNGIDPQLDKAIEIALDELSANPVVVPDFSKRPKKAIPPVPEGASMVASAGSANVPVVRAGDTKKKTPHKR
ncbi:MAG: S41 family peptidase [Candidatus Obscuribacterales bacterium]|nr:S41 family peptidase [Candidatus Obscuribacterales bacterium]